MISALKITADRIALSGVERCMNSRLQRGVNGGKCGRDNHKILGNIVGDAEGG